MAKRMTKAEIGRALARIRSDVLEEVVELVGQYRNPAIADSVLVIKQAIDTPNRARARLQEWITQHDAGQGAGAGVTFLNECLTDAGVNQTVATLNAQLAALEAQAQTVVDGVNGGWSWDQAADWIEANLPTSPVDRFSYQRLPLPAGYTTVWNEPY